MMNRRSVKIFFNSLVKGGLFGLTLVLVVFLVVLALQFWRTSWLEKTLTNVFKADKVLIETSAIDTLYPDLRVSLQGVSVYARDSYVPDTAALQFQHSEIAFNVPECICALKNALKPEHEFTWKRPFDADKLMLPVRELYIDSLHARLRNTSLGQSNFGLLRKKRNEKGILASSFDENGVENSASKKFLALKKIRIDNFIATHLKIDYQNDQEKNLERKTRNYIVALDTMALSAWIAPDSIGLNNLSISGTSQKIGIGERTFFDMVPFEMNGAVGLSVVTSFIDKKDYREYRIVAPRDAFSIKVASATLGADVQAMLKSELGKMSLQMFNSNVKGVIRANDLTGQEMYRMLGINNSIDRFNFHGDIDFSGTLTNAESNHGDLVINLDFGSKDISFKPSIPVLKDDRFDHLKFGGYITNGRSARLDELKLVVDSIVGSLAGAQFRGKSELSNFKKKEVFIKASLESYNASIDINALIKSLKEEKVPAFFIGEKLKGRLDLKVGLEGPLKYLNKEGIASDSINYSGILGFNEVNYETDDFKLKYAKGTIQLLDNNLYIPENKPVEGAVNGQKFSFYGSMLGLANHFIVAGNDFGVKNDKLKGEFELALEETSIPDILSQLKETDAAHRETTKNKSDSKYFFDVSKFGSQLSLAINMTGKGLTLLDSSLIPELKDKTLYFDDFKASAMLEGSEFNMNGFDFYNQNDTLRLDLKIDNAVSNVNEFKGEIHLASDSLRTLLSNMGQEMAFGTSRGIDFEAGMEWGFEGFAKKSDHWRSDEIDMTIALKNAYFRNINNSDPLKNIDVNRVNFKMRLDETHFNTPSRALWKIDSASASIDEHDLSLNMSYKERIINISTLDTLVIPFFSLYKYASLDSQFNAKTIKIFSDIKGDFLLHTSLEGDVEVGKEGNQRHERFKLPQQGFTGLRNFGFKFNSKQNTIDFRNITGDGVLKGDTITVSDLTGSINGNDFSLGARVRELPSSLLRDNPFKLDWIDFSSKRLDLTKFVSQSAPCPGKEEKSVKKATKLEGASNHSWNLDSLYSTDIKRFDIDIGHLSIKPSAGMPVQDVMGIRLGGRAKDRFLQFDTLSLTYAKGLIANGERAITIDYENSSKIIVSAPLSISHLQLAHLIDGLDNTCVYDNTIDRLKDFDIKGELYASAKFQDTIHLGNYKFGEYTNMEIEDLFMKKGHLKVPGYINANLLKATKKNLTTRGITFLANTFYGVKSRLTKPSDFVLKNESLSITPTAINIKPTELRSDIINIAACGIYSKSNPDARVKTLLKKARDKKAYINAAHDENATLNFGNSFIRPRLLFRKGKNKIRPGFGLKDEYCPRQ